MPKHVINVADERIQLQTRFGDKNLCAKCHQPISKIIINGKLNRGNRVDTEDNADNVISYHVECFDIELLGHIHSTTFTILYGLEVQPKLTRNTSVL